MTSYATGRFFPHLLMPTQNAHIYLMLSYEYMLHIFDPEKKRARIANSEHDSMCSVLVTKTSERRTFNTLRRRKIHGYEDFIFQGTGLHQGDEKINLTTYFRL